MKPLHCYNGIYYALETNTKTSQIGSGIQSCVKIKTSVGSEFIVRNNKIIITGSFRLKVLNVTIYSIQRMVIKELKSRICLS